MRAKDIAMLFQLPKGKRTELFQVLDELEDEGLICCKKGKYEKVIKEEKRKVEELLEGTFLQTAKGFGFVQVEGVEEDFYIREDDTLDAFHMDRVQIRVKPEKTGTRREAVVMQILGHTILEVVGTYQASQNFGFVVPDNARILQDIFIPREHTKGAQDGDKVVA